jgi:membrane peptidoglycan carboxypeptidase
MHPAMQRRRHRLMTRRATRRRNPGRGFATFLAVSLGVFVLFVGGMVAGTTGGLLAAYQYFAAGLPNPRILDGIELPASTYVYDRTGTVLLARFECENREQVTFADLPDSVVNATIASEDRTFWTNDGIDYQAVARAALANLRAGHVVQGASTITQQVIKYAGSIKQAEAARAASTAPPSLELDPGTAPVEQDPCVQPNLTFLQGRGFSDKIREQILARQVTAAYPGRAGKEKILETYLNLIFYGNRSYGIRAAAANFFGINDLHKLSLAQATFLAGLPQLPSAYDPYQPADHPRGPGPAMARRDEVLNAMLTEHYITLSEYNAAVATTWQQMKPSSVTSILREPHFSFRVEREAERILAAKGVADPAQAVRTGGYRIITTLDYKLQQAAKAEVTRYVIALADKNVHNGALVAINSATGEIVAYVGSVDYYNRTDPRVQGQFDVAGLGLRQIGSAFKPFTYTSAFRAREATPATMFVDAATRFGPNYLPTNADVQQHGPLLAMDALRYSLNVPSVMMQYLAGVPITAAFAESLGVASKQYILDQDPGLTLTLGSVPINLTNATQGYSAFASQGTLHPATTILEIRDRDNKVIYSLKDNGPKASHPMTTAEAYLTHWILQGNTDPRLNLWWGARAELTDPNGIRRDATAKTGTTNDFKDVTAFGYIPGSLTTGVWMGNNNQDPLAAGLFSANGPLYLWHDFMDLAINKPWDWNGKKPVPQTYFKQPPGVVTANICMFSGMAATSACGPMRQIPFLEGTVPPPDNVHGGSFGGVLPTPDASGNVPYRGSCFDIVAEVRNDPRRPPEWAAAAQRWADRLVNGETGARGDPNTIAKYGPDRIWLGISPVPGKPGYGQPICGHLKATPTPSPSPSPSQGPGPGSCQGHPNKCTPAPAPSAYAASASVTAAALLVPIFGIPMLAGLLPLSARLAGWMRRRLRRR